MYGYQVIKGDKTLKHSEYLAYSIVIPVFNAKNTLRELCTALAENMISLGKSFEIILVDDGSLDDSWSIIKDLASKTSYVTGFQLMRNSGQGAATMAGLAQSRGELIITMDDDLQNPPYEVPTLCQFMDEHPEIDVALGRPREKNHQFWRRISSSAINRLSNIMFSQKSNFRLTSFRIMRREVVTPLLRLNVPEPAIGPLLTTLTKHVANVDVDHFSRINGNSGYSLRKLLRLTLSKFLGFSTFPLRFLATMGLVGIGISILLGSYVLYRYLFGNITVPGWTTLVLLLIGLSGFIFLAFGIIGEYLQQILNQTRQSPIYVIRTPQISKNSSSTESENVKMTQSTAENP